jgi:hypothetical protein
VQEFEIIRENMGILPYNYTKIASKLDKTMQRWAKMFPEPRLMDFYTRKKKKGPAVGGCNCDPHV